MQAGRQGLRLAGKPRRAGDARRRLLTLSPAARADSSGTPCAIPDGLPSISRSNGMQAVPGHTSSWPTPHRSRRMSGVPPRLGLPSSMHWLFTEAPWWFNSRRQNDSIPDRHRQERSGGTVFFALARAHVLAGQLPDGPARARNALAAIARQVASQQSLAPFHHISSCYPNRFSPNTHPRTPE